MFQYWELVYHNLKYNYIFKYLKFLIDLKYKTVTQRILKI